MVALTDDSCNKILQLEFSFTEVNYNVIHLCTHTYCVDSVQCIINRIILNWTCEKEQAWLFVWGFFALLFSPHKVQKIQSNNKKTPTKTPTNLMNNTRPSNKTGNKTKQHIVITSCLLLFKMLDFCFLILCCSTLKSCKGCITVY